MSKRDYVNFARMIRAERHKMKHARELEHDSPYFDGCECVLNDLTEYMARMFKMDDDKFEYDKFIQACQLPEKNKGVIIMPKTINTRKQRAKELFDRLEHGPIIYAFDDKQQAEFKRRYDLWFTTWIEDDIKSLIPELRKESK